MAVNRLFQCAYLSSQQEIWPGEVLKVLAVKSGHLLARSLARPVRWRAAASADRCYPGEAATRHLGNYSIN